LKLCANYLHVKGEYTVFILALHNIQFSASNCHSMVQSAFTFSPILKFYE